MSDYGEKLVRLVMRGVRKDFKDDGMEKEGKKNECESAR